MADVRVLIADDEKVVRDALADLIEANDGLTVAAVVASADEAIAAAATVRPDVALVDVRMPGGGPKATRGILQISPGVRVLALSASGGRDTVLEMLQAGAAGYLVKGAPPGEVIAGIRSAALGKSPISADVAGDILVRVREQLATDQGEQVRRETLLQQITRVFKGDGLEMVYQPIFELEHRTVVGFEALARFSLEPRRPPNEWFAAAADLGMSVRLELEAVSRALAGIGALPPAVFLSVNLSPETLLSADLAGAISVGVAERLVIELTEHTPVADYARLKAAFASLRAAGAGLAIDDAGAGFASLRHILELAPRYIKLDISLTERIETDRAAFALAVALTSFAAAIDATIIAEGVETESQLTALQSLGIQLAQGYYLGKPAAMRQVVQPARPLAGAR